MVGNAGRPLPGPLMDKPHVDGSNTGHGWVYPRPDGAKARCGGPAMCKECAAELARKQAGERDVTVETYALGLMVEECAELQQLCGKALRFGIDTPGSSETYTNPVGPRDEMHKEAGDVLAAIQYAAERGVLDIEKVTARAAQKLAKLLNPDSRDSQGNRLAP